MRKLVLGAALYAAFGMTFCADTASAKAGDPSGQRPACRLAAAAPPLKLLSPTVVAENGVTSPVDRVSRRANYTPVPNAASAREPYFALLDRQPKAASIIVGVGF
jgi:hypothetical protein